MKCLTIPFVATFIAACPFVAQAQTDQNAGAASFSGSQSGAGAESNFYAGTNTSIYPQNTPSPTAPPFVTASPCMGTVSGAGTSPVVGIALGLSYKDGECESRANASALNSLGARAAAIQVMCQIDQVKNAMAAAGTPCSGVVETSLEVPAKPDEQAGYTATGPAYAIASGAVSPVPTELEQFCSTLDSKNAQDRPYLETECKAH